MRPRSLLPFVCLIVLGLTATIRGEERERVEFLHLTAHWAGYGDEEYVPFLREARPEVAQVGFYGAHFYSLAHTPQYKGYPAHFPVRGLDECGQWFEDLNRTIHGEKIKVVGHFNVEFLVGDPTSDEGPRGFFKFYRELWDEEKLGQRPVEDPIELLERDGDGKPLSSNSYSIGGMKEYWGCLRNPHWRAVLKAWVKRSIERGVDGLMINYFYRHNCLCEHCQRGFREYLAERFTAEELKEKFGIANLKQHRFEEIVCWHDPKTSTPLRLEMLRFSQISNKRAYDEVFVQYGRSLKPDLILGQWDHLGNFTQIRGDERCLLPGELWAKDEDYLWYSSGASAHFSDLENRFLGDVTLQARYIRGASGDKPFTIGKYENTRIRMAIAELAANGGAPMGFYTRFRDPEARREITRYYRFLSRHEDIYRANRPHGEALLLMPRESVHRGDLGPLERFKEAGRELLEAHVLFDVLPDDTASEEERARYGHVVDPAAGRDVEPGAWSGRSRFEAPWTVRVSASRPAEGGELDVHFVNYNRTEPEKARSAGRGIGDEKPIAAAGVRADVRLPEGSEVKAVEVLSPEWDAPRKVEFAGKGGRVKFEVPEFLVYAVARIRLAKGE